jgi:Cdc6-like AAA superfamily ATPase
VLQDEDKVVYETPYDEACAKLQLNAVPDEFPCRDKEQNTIRDYILRGIQSNGNSSSLYISGMPGTGKTATCLKIIKE